MVVPSRFDLLDENVPSVDSSVRDRPRSMDQIPPSLSWSDSREKFSSPGPLGSNRLSRSSKVFRRSLTQRSHAGLPRLQQVVTGAGAFF